MAVEEPLVDELDAFKQGTQSKAPSPTQVKQVDLLIRTTADVVAPVFAPAHSHGNQLHGSLTSTCSEPAKARKPKLPSMVQEVRTNSNYHA
jgi:hypothetical protein